MTILGRYRLNDAVVMTEVEDLPDDVRVRLPGDGVLAITKPGSRTPTRLLDEATAMLIRRFISPQTLIEAIIGYSADVAESPEDVLEEAFPLLKHMIRDRVLVSEEDTGEEPFEPLEEGESFGPFSVVKCIQYFDDSQVAQAVASDESMVALKIANDIGAEARMRHEAAFYAELDGDVTPRLVDTGVVGGHPFIALEWREGMGVGQAAATYRAVGDEASLARLEELVIELLSAYVQLHEAGIVHGDVHPSNAIVSPLGRITLVDLGLARRWPHGDQASLSRGGVAPFFEPELAKANLEGLIPPPPSPTGEQYSLSALVYYLLAGDHYQDFALDRQTIMRQICESSPRPLPRTIAGRWPGLEEVLAKGLAKEPRDRYSSLRAFGNAVSEALTNNGHPTPRRNPAPLLTPLDQLANNVRARIGYDGLVFRSGVSTAPTASVVYGAAGIALALYRIAQVTDDGDALALAQAWLSKARVAASDGNAFINPDMDVTESRIGTVSPYYSRLGLDYVSALLANATDDSIRLPAALDAYADAAQGAAQTHDLMLGTAGALLGCALLTEIAPNHPSLHHAGSILYQRLVGEMERLPPIGKPSPFEFYGIAHGWAGLLYAVLAWVRCTSTTLLDPIADRIEQLAACASRSGMVAHYPLGSSQSQRQSNARMAGWCHGSAGHIILWLAAHRAFMHPDYLRLAEMLAMDALNDEARIGSLCCGLGGRAYALLGLYRHTGEARWLEGARNLGQAAVHGIRPANLPMDSLYKGEVGLLALAFDLQQPERSAMPAFELEGW